MRGGFRTAMAAAGGVVLAGLQVMAQVTSNMTVLSQFLPPNTTAACSGIWGWTSPVTKKEYALVTIDTPGGLSIVDISNPRQPSQVVKIAGTNSNWQEVTTYRNYAYKIHQLGSLGIQIIDLAPLNTGGTPRLVKNFTQEFTNAHTIYCDTANARLFVAYGNTSGVMIFSLANPETPVKVADLRGEAHDMYAAGNRLYISTQNRGTVEIWNLANVSTPQRLGIIDLRPINQQLGEPQPMAHSAWPTADQKILFTAEETAGGYTKSFDITNPASPRYLGRFKARANIISHNVYVHGKYLYVAHNNLGLRIWNIDNPAAMKEEAHHSPSTSTALFGGTWGAYPFFPSGLLIHGDRDLGLYVLDPAAHLKQVGPVSLAPASQGGTFSANWDGNGLRFRLPRDGGYALSILDGAGRELFRRQGDGKAGAQSLALDRRFASGQYLLRLEQGARSLAAPVAFRN